MKAVTTNKSNLYHYQRILNAGSTNQSTMILLDPYVKDGSQGVVTRFKGWWLTH